MATSLTHLRNLGIIAHIDAGKTTVTEQMLYVSGAKHRAGEVDKGTTTTDDDTEEEERGITIYSACVQFPWKDVEINLIDTPGHVDFTAEVERSLRVLDGAVIVFSAREGVEAQSETVWRQADKYHVPRLAMINKMDREGADFYEVFDEIGTRLNARPVAIQIPVGQGPAHVDNPFHGVIDLVSMQMLTFPHEPGSRQCREVQAEPIPDELADEAKKWRERLLESLYDFSNEMMELALGEEPIPEALVHRVLRDATVHQQIQPVLCGSALHGMGVQPLLDAVAAYLPNPLDRPPVKGTDPIGSKKHSKGKAKEAAKDGDSAKVVRKPDATEPFCGLVFKILPYKTGDLYWVRIYSGTLKPNSRVLNAGRDKRRTSPSSGGSMPRRRTSSSKGLRPAILSPSLASASRSPATRSATPATRYCSNRSSFPRRLSRWPSSRRIRPRRKSSPKRWPCSASRTPPLSQRKTRRPAKRSSAAWASCTSR